jgi:hypothetical protein
MGMQHIEFASQKKAAYSMHVVSSFHHIKHKCSWMCSQISWKQLKCYEENLFSASQYIVKRSASQNFKAKIKSQMKVYWLWANFDKPYTNSNKGMMQKRLNNVLGSHKNS